MKNTALFMCLSFMPKLAIDPIFVPMEVRKIIKNRIEAQYKSQFPNRDLRFDDSSCSDTGSYEFRNQSLTLIASHEFWQGSQEYQLNNILDGIKLEFPTYESNPVEKNNTKKMSQTTLSLNQEYEQDRKSHNKWYWIGGVALTAIAGGLFMKMQNSEGSLSPTTVRASSSTPAPRNTPTQGPRFDPGKGRKP
jgi:hypothetical protein